MRWLVGGTTTDPNTTESRSNYEFSKVKKGFLAARQRTMEIHTKRGRRLFEDETMDL